MVQPEGMGMPSREHCFDFVVVANRLPVDRVESPDGSASWRQAPGGLVTALRPVMRRTTGAWVGWAGSSAEDTEPFEHAGMHLIPVALSQQEVDQFYEGFSNATIWPLYHDVIAKPVYDRATWAAYDTVNERFADVAAACAAQGATVWVQDYQLQLVPKMLRALRPDLRIGYFNHIPFPPYEIFAQLPWARRVVEGLLGSDLVGFQRVADANNFLRACRRTVGVATKSNRLTWLDPDGCSRTVTARAYPISIDSAELDTAARSERSRKTIEKMRQDIGPRKVLLGVDRLDYTKGIRHRLAAYEELLDEGAVNADKVVLVQIATPSRERVEAYMRIREDIELLVGRINGDHSTLGRPAVQYLRTALPREQMPAVYQVADVMLVTALRDGMNLVAKEFVACRHDERGVLLLSAFTGAADELKQAVIVNPHDIDGLKSAMLAALRMPAREQRRRMKAMRKRVLAHDVARWAQSFLDDLRSEDRGASR
ncbi:MAG: alpha,alpha-trehalose-phosphate synthase (UDP-forming) [Dermatophilaceae bacterium]